MEKESPSMTPALFKPFPHNATRQRTGYLVQRALRVKLLKKTISCQDCKKLYRRLEGHHEDYSKPFEVTWLCGSCHKYRHIVYKDRNLLSREVYKELCVELREVYLERRGPTPPKASPMTHYNMFKRH